ncbi:MAG TPA: hypothetical protein IAA10_02595 [Candidatus Blautia intestinavium]|nr:hypothetical protein [Candidatus Blautia intestinavium]
MFTVNAEQKRYMCGMMGQDMCMDMSMFCCAFMYQRLPEASAGFKRIPDVAGV